MELAEYDLSKYIHQESEIEEGRTARPILDETEAKEILLSMMSAVQSLHEASPPILHRDINPTNILRLFDGRWVLADFSLAKFMHLPPLSTSFVSGSRQGMGTAHYTAPEQYTSLRETDVRTDIYSLGWLIWELFSKEGPFPRQEPSGLPERLEKVFLKSTEYAKEARYQSVGEMREELETSLD
jgi:serine/threonine protein kinase